MRFGAAVTEPADTAACIRYLRAKLVETEADRDRFEAALARSCLVVATTYLIERADKAETERDAALAQVAEARAHGIREAAMAAPVRFDERDTFEIMPLIDQRAILALIPPQKDAQP